VKVSSRDTWRGRSSYPLSVLILVPPVSHYHAGLIAVGRAGVAVCDSYLTRAGRASPQPLTRVVEVPGYFFRFLKLVSG
jgi:hypothetical protein